MPELVERGAELQALSRVVAAATGSGRAGRAGRFVQVIGPAGIGKSSLLAESAQLGEQAGARVLSARAIELEQELAFGVVRQLFQPALAGHPHRSRLLAGAAAPAATVLDRRVLDRHEQHVAALGDFAVLHGLYWLTANLCRGQPHLLVIDDLQWADRASLRYLTYLQPRLGDLPLTVIAAARPHDPKAEHHLLDLLTTDPSVTVLRPQPLTVSGAATLVSDSLRTAADPTFSTACHTATGGNPLLLRQLTDAITMDGLVASAENARRVAGLVPRGLEAWIGMRLAKVPAECAALADAVAVLGDDVPPRHAEALAGLTPQQAARAALQLRQIHVLDDPATGGGPGHELAAPLRFVHPLVRAAVYEGIDPTELPAAHAAAAALLYRDPTCDPELVSAHLLRIPPTGDPEHAAALRLSADNALRRGSPDTALTYLRRCLKEPLDGPTRLAMLGAAGAAATNIDLGVADELLGEALRLTTEPVDRGELAYQLGRVRLYLGRYEEFRQLCQDAIDWLPEGAVDLRRRLQAGLVNLGIAMVQYPELPALVAELRALDPHPSLGGRMLDAIIAAYDATVGDPAAIARAERSIADGLLIDRAVGDTALNCAWWALLAADRDSAMASLNAGVAQSHQLGSINSLAATLTFRGLGWLWRGQLGEAVSDLRRAVEAADTARIQIAHIFTGPWLADALIEQGDLAGAAAALEWVGAPDPLPPGPWYLYLHSRAQLLRRQGDHPAAVATAVAAGENFAALGGSNPAFLWWRSEAALSLHALGRGSQARRYAAEELELARRWGAPRALGRALRVAGVVNGQPSGLIQLREAVEVLDGSPARLEYAKALIDLGTALRRAGLRPEARTHLARGLDLANHCGATPLTQHAETELRATGARPRRLHLTGTQALTPSELRVAELAATGHTNRDIAQQLFITIKTVEIHLGNTYRKLGITRRHDLTSHLATPTPAG